MKVLGGIVGMSFVLMAAIPILMAMVIFAPLIIVLAFACVLLEGD